jgi:mannose PTS system EIIA component
MSESEAPVRGVVLTHGSMCHGMVDAVQKIAGVSDDALVAVSNEGRGPDDLLETVARVAGDGPALIFTDLRTGSCALAARFACRDPGNRKVIFGANLPMLLDFVFHRDMPLDHLVDRLLERGRAEIRTLEPSPTGEHRPAPGG